MGTAATVVNDACVALSRSQIGDRIVELQTAVASLQTHANANKTAIDAIKTLVNTCKSVSDANKVLVNASKTVSDDNKALVNAAKVTVDLLRTANATGVFTTGTLAEATTTTKIKTTTTYNYKIDGKMYYKAATDNLFDCTGIGNLTTDYKCIKLILDAAGTGTVVDGTGSVDAAAALLAAGATPANKCCVGYYTVGDGTSHDFAAADVTADGGAFLDGDPDEVITATSAAVSSSTGAAVTAANGAAVSASTGTNVSDTVTTLATYD